jgi:D-glycero-alpha-D-manno-heptose 1-phosphate guanylyltransferase
MDALILAGGLGKRLRTVVNDRPKPMALIGNKPFLAVLLNFLLNSGVKKAILSVGYKHEKILEYFGNNYNGCEIEYSLEDKPLGTGGAIAKSIKHIKSDNFLICNGDTFFNFNLENYLNFHKEKKSVLSICGFLNSETDRYDGIDHNKDNKIISFSSQKSNICNAGSYLCKLKYFEKLDLPNVFSFERYLKEAQCKKNNFFVYTDDKEEKFIDIGLPDDYNISGLFLKQFMEK